MAHRIHLVDTGSPAPIVWPSIASASAELRRPRHLHAVPARTQNHSAVVDRVAPLGAPAHANRSRR